MARTEKTISIVIFIILVLAFSISSGYQFIGDYFEKIINAAGMLESLIVLVALFGIYKDARLFTSNQLKIIAYFGVFITIATYFYPWIKYSEQNGSDFFSTFIYDAILNVIIFILLIKESKK